MREIHGYEGLYAVTEDGKVWAYPKRIRHVSKAGKEGTRVISGRFLKTWLIGHGYKTVSLYKEVGKDEKFLVHRLVAIAYIPNTEDLREVNHKDGDRLNNKVENLEWVTSKQNKAHAWANGSYWHKGDRHWTRKKILD